MSVNLIEEFIVNEALRESQATKNSTENENKRKLLNIKERLKQKPEWFNLYEDSIENTDVPKAIPVNQFINNTKKAEQYQKRTKNDTQM